ncbi:MAG: AAA family ATPase [Bacteroidota bacterium]
MKLTQITIKKLHGYLNSDFSLKDDLVLLVGINGAGKTSTLNAINWMLNMDMGKLFTEAFELIDLKFEYLNENFRFYAEQNNEHCTIYLQNITTGHSFPPLVSKLFSDPIELLKSPSKKARAFEFANTSTPEPAEIETWEFIKKLPSPMIIGLDRTLYTSKNKEIIVEEQEFARRESSEAHNKITTPLQMVSMLLQRQYAVHTGELLKLNRVLNETILLSSFEKIYTTEQIAEDLSAPTPALDEIKNVRNKVIHFLEDNHNSQRTKVNENTSLQNLSTDKINEYFDSLTEVLSQKSKSEKGFDLAYIMNLSQISRVNRLINAFNDFELKSQKETAPLDEFLDVVNGFFKDSAKKLYFTKGTGLLRYDVIDTEGKVKYSGNNINTLSSGERQILILLTYIKYRMERVFLIDEPELSLHVKWQEDFLNAIQRIKRKGIQIIIATHSPEIIGNYRENCKILNPYQ